MGTVGAGRIGLAALRRLKPFGVDLHYSDPHRLPPAVELELGATFHPTAASLVRSVDAVLLNCPLVRLLCMCVGVEGRGRAVACLP